MRFTCELALDYHSAQERAQGMPTFNRLLDVIGHDPVNCAFTAVSPEAIVHGRVEEVLWCDTRILGHDKIGFKDGRVEIATQQNIDRWFREQGHRLMKVEGFKAFGNTVVKLQITEVDEASNEARKTVLQRPRKRVVREVIEKRLSQLEVV